MKKIFTLLLLSYSICAAPPKVIFFDYGGVMADVDRTPILQFISDSLGVSYDIVKKDFARDRLYYRLTAPQSFWDSYGSCKLPENWGADLECKKRAVVRPTPGMDELVTILRDEGVVVAILSNTDKARSLFLRSMGSYSSFAHVILSCDVGVKKPDPRIFTLALKRLNIKPNECLFIDDKKRNVKAAKKLGIDGIVFESKDQLAVDLIKRGILVR